MGKNRSGCNIKNTYFTFQISTYYGSDMKFYYYDEFLYNIKKVKSVSPFFYTFTENDVTDIVLLFIFSS